ncbi:MAG: diadenylate cyclase CdaA [Clostridia bacterium]|nr:diadenylate cyclase CdaA [Clostridia bacterium]
MEWIKHIFRLFTAFDFFDLIDIAILAIVIFSIYQFIKERRAGKLALGVALLFAFVIVCEVLNLHAMQFLLGNLFESGIIVLAIIFQPELRSALEKMGDTSIKGIKNIGEQRNATPTGTLIEEFTEAVFDLAKTKTGALIVFERNTKLGEIILTGTVINAQFSGNLLKSIFFNKAPLHDGAVVIRSNRIHSAACILPLESDRDLFKDLGTRHRAAIGISEVSDCVAVVVSEETGIVSIAHEGNIYRNFTKTSMKSTLQEYLVKGSGESKKKLGSKIKINSKKN